MKERLFVIAFQRSIGETWWIVGEKAGPRSRKYVKTWSFRTRAEAMHLIETLGRLVEETFVGLEASRRVGRGRRLPRPAAQVEGLRERGRRRIGKEKQWFHRSVRPPDYRIGR